jgi:hypothetical protein
VLLLVDAANVVGTRPDGWWRDRAGAAGRLVARLADLPGTQLAGVDVDEVVVVLEGRARDGCAVTDTGAVRVVHAPACGDDALAARCGPGVVLVTADRELGRRADAAGAGLLSPSRLLGVLDARRPGPR